MEIMLDAIDLVDFSVTIIEPIDFAAAELRVLAYLIRMEEAP